MFQKFSQQKPAVSPSQDDVSIMSNHKIYLLTIWRKTFRKRYWQNIFIYGRKFEIYAPRRGDITLRVAHINRSALYYSVYIMMFAVPKWNMVRMSPYFLVDFFRRFPSSITLPPLSLSFNLPVIQLALIWKPSFQFWLQKIMWRLRRGKRQLDKMRRAKSFPTQQ